MIEVRARLTEHVNRARLKLELRRGARPAIVVAVGAVVGLACFGYIAAHVSKTLLQDTYLVRFAVDDATAVVPGRDEVRVKGIPAGTITKVDIVDGRPVVTAEIQSKYGPIYRNARAELRPNTALEDMYLDIVDRGTRSAGAARAQTPLPASQTDTSVNITDVLNVFRADVRAHFRAVLNNLGNGLKGRGDALRTAFVELAPFLRVAGRMSQQLAERGAETRRLVHNVAVLDSELGRRDGELRTLVRAGSSTMETLQAGSADLDATLHELPPTLSTIDTSFAAVRAVLGDVDDAITNLRPVAGQLPRSLSALRRLSVRARPALRALRRPVERLVPLSRALIPLSANLSTAVSALEPQMDTFDHVTKDVAGCKRPIQGFFQWDASLAKFSDFRGGVARGNAEYNMTSSGVASDPRAYFHQACTPGTTLGGRPPGPEDER